MPDDHSRTTSIRTIFIFHKTLIEKIKIARAMLFHPLVWPITINKHRQTDVSLLLKHRSTK